MRIRIGSVLTIMLVAAVVLASSGGDAWAASAAEINREADTALRDLYARTPAAKQLGRSAKGILIFPRIVKGGFIFGGQFGDGVLRKGKRTAGYYRMLAGSYGFQAGLQSFGYVMFFMTDSALDYLRRSQGWEFGAGPSVVLLDEGMAKSFTTTTARDDVYAIFFDQTGLMAGVGLQGSKITPIAK
jgi:lipid-binding SYLF domain-containing protein